MKRPSPQRVGAPSAVARLAAQLVTLQPKKKPRRGRVQAGIQSLESGVALLKALVASSRPMKLKDIAAAANMSASKAHRYVVSLCRSGLVAQDGKDAQYRLGPYALDMALACLNSLHPVKIASQALETIGREIDLTVAIAAWGNHGPTIIRIEEALHAVSMNVRAGTVVPLARSASGLVFAAFMPRHVVEPLLARELPRAAERRQIEAELEAVRRTGVGAVSQRLVPGADALAVPVFDHGGAIVLALMAIGTSGSFSVEADGQAALALKRHAAALSNQLGYRN